MSGELAYEVLGLLFVVALLAGCLDTLAGGGGLLVLPALILAGLPPLAALGTNKLQGTMGTATATWFMFRHRRIQWSEMKTLMGLAFLGSALGTCIVQFINTDWLRFIIPAVLVVIAAYFLFSHKIAGLENRLRVTEPVYRHRLVPLVGAYDGMFGPGTGSLFAMLGVATRGQDILLATARAKALNFATNVASLIIFMAVGQIYLKAGVVMMLGQWLGAWVGAHSLYRFNPLYLRYLITLVCVAMLARYLYAL